MFSAFRDYNLVEGSYRLILILHEEWLEGEV